MKNRVFYEKRTLKKFRIVFETLEIIVGADRKNKHRTFRKDTGLIAFSRREAIEMKLNDLTNRQQTEAESNEIKHFSNFNCPVLGFNYS